MSVLAASVPLLYIFMVKYVYGVRYVRNDTIIFFNIFGFSAQLLLLQDILFRSAFHTVSTLFQKHSGLAKQRFEFNKCFLV